MKILKKIACILTFTASISICFGDTPVAVRATIQHLYDGENAAAGHLNVAGIVADLDPNFVSIDPQGQSRDYRYTVDNANRMVSIARSVAATSSIRTCHVNGRTAILTVYSRIVVTFDQSGNNSPSHDVITDLAQDTWVRSGTHWRQVKSIDLDAHESIDGQPVSSNGSG